MDKQKARRVAITLFLLSIFVFLVFYMGAWVLGIFESAKITAEGEEGEALTFSCVGLVFDVQEETMTYDGNTLRASVANKKYSESKISEITVLTGDEQRNIPVQMMPGDTRDIELDIELGPTVSIFPTGCEMYAKAFEIQ